MKNLANYIRLCLLLAIGISVGSAADAQGIRKHYTEMTNQERIAYKSVMTTLNNTGVREYFTGLHVDPNQDDTNSGNNTGNAEGASSFDQIHGILEFLSWHRQFVREFEWEIQSVADYLTIPYWDWTGASDPAFVHSESVDGPLWSDEEINVIGWSDNFLGSFNAQFGLGRTLGSGSLPSEAQVDALMLQDNINVFHTALEMPVHGPPHGWVGGDMADMNISPNDPVFYLHHSMVDKIWQDWTEIDGHNSGFDDNNMPTWTGNIDDFPHINQNTITDSRQLGIFYSDAPAGVTTMETYTVTNAVRPVEKFNYQYRIEAENGFTVPSGKTAEFRSCNKIRLRPGFTAKLGSSFLAKIDADCDFSTLQMVSHDKGHQSNDANERENSTAFGADFGLRNYPNPFINETTIEYSLGMSAEVSLVLYNVMGQPVKFLVQGQNQESGTHQVQLQTRDLPAGIYYCRLEGNGERQIISLSVSK